MSDNATTGAAANLGIKVTRYVDPAKLTVDLSYSTANLSGGMVNQASLFAFYATLAAKASRQVDEIDLRIDVLRARISRELRDEAAKAGQKTTVAEIEGGVLTSQKFIAMRQALNEAKQVESEAKTAVEAFRHRRDMLVQLGAHEREELKGELRTKGTVELARRAMEINKGAI